MPTTESSENRLRRKIKIAIIITIAGLLLNGISAVPLCTELKILLSRPDALPQFLHDWWLYVNKGVKETTSNYPFMRYGFDWLAFAHLLIAKPKNNKRYNCYCCINARPPQRNSTQSFPTKRHYNA